LGERQFEVVECGHGEDVDEEVGEDGDAHLAEERRAFGKTVAVSSKKIPVA